MRNVGDEVGKVGWCQILKGIDIRNVYGLYSLVNGVPRETLEE